jgi:3-oxoacyl-(acyl-carrier-protein) synthase
MKLNTNGHLTHIKRQFRNRKLSEALGRSGIKLILKSGHCLSAAGSIESIAAVLQLHQGFFSKY